jgi:TIR domain-containing protein
LDTDAYDLFVSHAPADRGWVEGYLLPALGVPGDRVIIPGRFRPGAPAAAEYERAVRISRYSVLVLSPAYLSDVWSSLGEQLLSHAAVTEKPGRLIPLLLAECVVPWRLDFRVRLDFRDPRSWESETRRIAALLHSQVPPEDVLPCPYPGILSFSEDQHALFFGRDEEIGRCPAG